MFPQKQSGELRQKQRDASFLPVSGPRKCPRRAATGAETTQNAKYHEPAGTQVSW